MNYREKGQKFCEEINNLLSDNEFKMAFVPGGGFAYDSIKYAAGNTIGDYDFMIVYEEEKDLEKLLEILKKSNFDFDDKYIDLDLDLLLSKKIDIIRLSGKYLDVKSTINLVPLKLVKEIADFKSDLVIKKVAHSRNTSLFFAYGSDNSRIITNFISPSFITDDGEDHYIHLDFSHIEKNNNMYLGILSDAILKGFRNEYDSIDFKSVRKNYINKIHEFFAKNNIDSSCYINLFSNNNYFPEYLKDDLLEEFNEFGILSGKKENPKYLEPIIFSTEFDIDYKKNPFNFIKNKPFKTYFDEYIKQMQSNEYDRQYLLDALGKFFGYLLSTNFGNEKYNGPILNKILVYGTNDLYLPDFQRYSLQSIIKTIIDDVKINKNKLNNELVRNYLIVCMKFYSMIINKPIENVLEEEKISNNIFNPQLDSEMNIEIIKKLNSFNEVGTYHNYSSKVMPKYTVTESKFLESIFENKNAKILDVMCGYGRLANQLVKNGYNKITGIDSENYEFLGVNKDFIFINDEFLKYPFTEKYNYAYSLYNCYSSEKELMENITKTHTILDGNGLFIIDFFNKKWRDSIEPGFYKELYKDDKYKLIVTREYDKVTGKEITYYKLYYKDSVVNTWQFTQKFFEIDKIVDMLDLSKWNYSLYDSGDLETRTNQQKYIMLLRKK